MYYTIQYFIDLNIARISGIFEHLRKVISRAIVSMCVKNRCAWYFKLLVNILVILIITNHQKFIINGRLHKFKYQYMLKYVIFNSWN